MIKEALAVQAEAPRRRTNSELAAPADLNITEV
jgi:hypothetical protein